VTRLIREKPSLKPSKMALDQGIKIHFNAYPLIALHFVSKSFPQPLWPIRYVQGLLARQIQVIIPHILRALRNLSLFDPEMTLKTALLAAEHGLPAISAACHHQTRSLRLLEISELNQWFTA
jgi:hypothetical protein